MNMENTDGGVIQVAIEMLMPYTYSWEYLEGISYNRDLAEDKFMYDCSIVVELLGGCLYTKKDFININ